jgi:hypothetical protein
MRMQHSAVVEVQQLMFAAAFDTDNPRTNERAQLRRLEPALQGGMEQLYTRDGATLCACPQYIQRGFDFW